MTRNEKKRWKENGKWKRERKRGIKIIKKNNKARKKERKKEMAIP